MLVTEEMRGEEGIWTGSKNAENSGIGERDDGSHAGVDDEKSGKGVAPPGVEACGDDNCCSDGWKMLSVGFL